MAQDSLDYARELIEKADKLFQLAERLDPRDPGYNGWGAAAFAFVFLGLLGMGIAYLKDRRNERNREAERTDYLARLEKLELQREAELKQRREDDLRRRAEDLANLERWHKEDAKIKGEVRKALRDFLGGNFDQLFGATNTGFDQVIGITKAIEGKYGDVLDAVARLESKVNEIATKGG